MYWQKITQERESYTKKILHTHTHTHTQRATTVDDVEIHPVAESDVCMY